MGEREIESGRERERVGEREKERETESVCVCERAGQTVFGRSVSRGKNQI